MNNEEINRVVYRAARAVALEWPGVIEVDDLAQELWVQILESPATQEILSNKSARDQMNLLARMGHRTAARYRNDSARFSNQVRYSVDDIKDALTGRSLWPEIVDDIALGMDALRGRNASYADAIEMYLSDTRPTGEVFRKRLQRAIEALTDETNAAVRQLFDGAIPTNAVTEDEYVASPFRTASDGPGSKRRTFPKDVNNSKSIFDAEFNAIPGIDMYRSWVEPEMYPDERPARIENWTEYDREDTWSV